MDKSAHNTFGQRRQEENELIRNVEALVEKGDRAKANAEDISPYLKRTVTAL